MTTEKHKKQRPDTGASVGAGSIPIPMRKPAQFGGGQIRIALTPEMADQLGRLKRLGVRIPEFVRLLLEREIPRAFLEATNNGAASRDDT